MSNLTVLEMPVTASPDSDAQVCEAVIALDGIIYSLSGIFLSSTARWYPLPFFSDGG